MIKLTRIKKENLIELYNVIYTSKNPEWMHLILMNISFWI